MRESRLSAARRGAPAGVRVVRRVTSALGLALATAALGCSREGHVLEIARPALSAPFDEALVDLKKTAPQTPSPPLPAKVKPWAPPDSGFVYPLPFDFGVRKDHGGSGYFLSPRKHGSHAGIDFLAPVGTNLFAICDGKAKTAMRGGYGRTVQLVCKLPDDLGGNEGLYVSFFYAHLSKSLVPSKYEEVKAGAKIGEVGKTGNAAGPDISPHLHLEAIVRGSEGEALAEHHSGLEPRAKKAVDTFYADLEQACLAPARLRSHEDVRRERRVDPFVLLVCSTRPKPGLSTPSDEALRAASLAWSTRYAAGAFDVGLGPRPVETSDD